MCMKVVAAVRELQTEYNGRLDFNIISGAETQRSYDKIAEYGFIELKHGLVIFSAAGEPIVTLPGHQYGKAEIAAGIEQVLAR